MRGHGGMPWASSAAANEGEVLMKRIEATYIAYFVVIIATLKSTRLKSERVGKYLLKMAQIMKWHQILQLLN